MKRQREETGAEIDVDHGFLDQVLNKLYDFGGEGKRSAKLKRRKRKSEEDNEDDDDDHDEEEEDNLNEKFSGVKAGLSHVTVATGDDAVPTTGSSSKAPAPKQTNVEVVTFLDPRKKKTSKRVAKPEAKPPEVKDKKKDADEGLTIEKARLEVHRFGITGFHKQQQRVFEQDRAIMLGARPPKKEYVNYKVYQEMISEKKLKEKEESLKSNAHGQKKKKPGRQKTEKRKRAPSGKEPTGLMGRFKDGVLLVNSRDIQKMNSKRRK